MSVVEEKARGVGYTHALAHSLWQTHTPKINTPWQTDTLARGVKATQNDSVGTDSHVMTDYCLRIKKYRVVVNNSPVSDISPNNI